MTITMDNIRQLSTVDLVFFTKNRLSKIFKMAFQFPRLVKGLNVSPSIDFDLRKIVPKIDTDASNLYEFMKWVYDMNDEIAETMLLAKELLEREDLREEFREMVNTIISFPDNPTVAPIYEFKRAIDESPEAQEVYRQYKESLGNSETNIIPLK